MPETQPGAAEAAEADRIRAIYRRYDTSEHWLRKRDPDNPGFSRLQEERWHKIAVLLDARLRGTARPRILDVGCGTGGDLARIGKLLPGAELFGVDLIETRVQAARRAVPGAALSVQGGEALPFSDRSMQLVLLSTVLSSILDPGTRRRVAAEAYRVTADDGILLVYDIRLPSPANPHVRRIGQRELRALLPAARIQSHPITLLPPLARGVCRIRPGLYRPLARLRPLRSHYLSVVTRP
ncbi:MAG: class I SAM-dependent methyltransferase [Actinobacteria bacterium]|nr:class I SAM-dependent methyltransferase [Actinomycetota bacterium]